MTLNDLATQFNTDKAQFCHNYGVVYESLFDKFKDKVEVFLEIGISEGASMKMWHQYFTNAEIHGIDILDFNQNNSGALGERVVTHKADQSVPDDLIRVMNRIGKPLDIVVDDGSHGYSDIITSLTTLYPYLKSGGLYLIEDIEMPRQLDEYLKPYEHWFAVADSPILNSNIICIRKP